MSNFKTARKYHFIYKTTNLINGKYYIGMHSTNELTDGYIGSGKRLWYSINKYGIKNFKCEILEFLPDRITLANRERELVNEDTIKDPNCMNLKKGGTGGFSVENAKKGRQKTDSILKKKYGDNFKSYISKRFHEIETTEQKLQRRTKIKNRLTEFYKNNPGTFTGKKHKPETIEKMKLASIGKGICENNSQFGTCWITNGTMNKKIKRTALNNFLEDGWKLGRIFL